MYNFKALHYADGSVQSRFYSHTVHTGKKEIVNKREYIENPFDGEEVEVVHDFDELERREERARHVSRNRTIQNIYNYARSNKWEFFVTLTFNPDKVNRFDYGECTRKLSQWLKNMKKQFPDMIYLMVPELHLGQKSETDAEGNHAWHFHGLMSGISDCMEFSGHFTKAKQPVYNIGKYNYGWSTATEVETHEAACKYLTKYITKDLCEVTKGRKRYWVSRNCKKPIEETRCLTYSESDSLYNELLEDAQEVKIVEADCGLEKRMVIYVESKETVFYFPDE